MTNRRSVAAVSFVLAVAACTTSSDSLEGTLPQESPFSTADKSSTTSASVEVDIPDLRFLIDRADTILEVVDIRMGGRTVNPGTMETETLEFTAQIVDAPLLPGNVLDIDPKRRFAFTETHSTTETPYGAERAEEFDRLLLLVRGGAQISLPRPPGIQVAYVLGVKGNGAATLLGPGAGLGWTLPVNLSAMAEILHDQTDEPPMTGEALIIEWVTLVQDPEVNRHRIRQIEAAWDAYRNRANTFDEADGSVTSLECVGLCPQGFTLGGFDYATSCGVLVNQDLGENALLGAGLVSWHDGPIEVRNIGETRGVGVVAVLVNPDTCGNDSEQQLWYVAVLLELAETHDWCDQIRGVAVQESGCDTTDTSAP